MPIRSSLALKRYVCRVHGEVADMDVYETETPGTIICVVLDRDGRQTSTEVVARLRNLPVAMRAVVRAAMRAPEREASR